MDSSKKNGDSVRESHHPSGAAAGAVPDPVRGSGKQRGRGGHAQNGRKKKAAKGQGRAPAASAVAESVRNADAEAAGAREAAKDFKIAVEEMSNDGPANGRDSGGYECSCVGEHHRCCYSFVGPQPQPDLDTSKGPKSPPPMPPSDGRASVPQDIVDMAIKMDFFFRGTWVLNHCRLHWWGYDSREYLRIYWPIIAMICFSMTQMFVLFKMRHDLHLAVVTILPITLLVLIALYRILWVRSAWVRVRFNRWVKHEALADRRAEDHALRDLKFAPWYCTVLFSTETGIEERIVSVGLLTHLASSKYTFAWGTSDQIVMERLKAAAIGNNTVNIDRNLVLAGHSVVESTAYVAYLYYKSRTERPVLETFLPAPAPLVL